MRFLLVFLSLMCSHILMAQGYIIIKGDIKRYATKTPLQDVKVFSYIDGILADSVLTDKNGKYKLPKIKASNKITIKFTKEDYVGKFAEIDPTGMHPEDSGIFPLEISVSLFMPVEGLDYSILNTNPIAKAKYDKEIDNIVWDIKYIEEMRSKFDKLDAKLNEILKAQTGNTVNIDKKDVSRLLYEFRENEKKVNELKVEYKRMDSIININKSILESKEKELATKKDELDSKNVQLELKNKEFSQISKEVSARLLDVAKLDNKLKKQETQILENQKSERALNESIRNQITELNSHKKKIKQQIDSLENLNRKVEQKNLTIEDNMSTIGSQKTTITLFAGGVLSLLVLSLLVLRGYQQKRKSNKLILLQKAEVEQQKKIVEEKNHEILDSINYAKRIQTAILPPSRVVKEYLKESFILYKPKDIVAGDFYWLENKNGNILLAACDCTGHGVPGAMVSVVCNNGLNRSVREYGLTDPGKILDKTREIVIQEFEKSEEEVKDGMDISLINLQFSNDKITNLKWAGANNPLWIIRNGEIIETKANKQPIGKYENPQPFTTHEIDLVKGDLIYIFTDGYADQFGGEKGKKFKSSKFKDFLLTIRSKSMEDQRNLIDSEFELWKKDLEQNDDVCVIGIKI